MIDIESYVYTQVRNAVLGLYEGVYVTGSYTQTPKQLPCVMLTMTDNYVVEKGIDSSGVENETRVVFTVEVYTDFKSQKKVAAKALFQCVDEVMGQLNLVRTMYSSLPNMDKTIQRITGRYRGALKFESSANLLDPDTIRIYSKE